MSDPGSVFDIEVWAPALVKYGAVTQLSLSLYDVDGQRVAGPLPETALFAMLHPQGRGNGLFGECVSACLAQPVESRPPVVVTRPSGLSAVGVSLRLQGRIVGVVVAGYALTQFAEPVTISRLARDAGVPYADLWALVRRLPPVQARRLIEHGELLQVLGDALLQETDLRRQSVATAEQLSHQASHDSLTDLPNRALLGDRLVHALSLARRHDGRVGVLFVDIDRFKHINDSVGHQGGDQLLQTVGAAMLNCLRQSDTVGRQGGDEFVVVLSDLDRPEDAAKAARKIVNCVAGPHRIAGHEIRVTVSIGISVYPEDGDDPQTLFAHADMALYHAKELGRDQFQFFEAGLNVRAIERREIEAGLSRALARGEFQLAYQPKVNLRTGMLVGVEALIRWHDPQRGLVPPDQFVPIAEDTGLMWPIGRWVLREACQQAAAWQQQGLPPITMAVNVSAVEFRHKGFLNNVVEVLQHCGLDPRYLEIELTETALMPQTGATSSVLRGLKNLGVQLAIDDFGTGWSSLSYLRQLPVDTLKIDRSFVEEIASDTAEAPIVSAIISMGQKLRLRVVAEGVETAAQLAFLQAEECNEGQGYYFSRPLTAEQFAKVLESGLEQFPVDPEENRTLRPIPVR